MGLCASRTRDLFPFSQLYSAKLKNGETYSYRQLLPSSENPNKGDVVIFLHATNFSGIMMNTGGLLQQLSSSNPEYRFIAPDMRGYGYSTYNTKIKTLWDFADDIKEFCDALYINKVIIVGTCLGGMVAQLMAIRHPEYVRGIVLIGALGPSGGAHLFEHEKTFPKSYEEIATSSFYTSFEGLIKSGDKDGLKKVLDNYQPRNVINSENFDLAVKEMLLARNGHEVIWGELNINITAKNNGHVDGTNDLKRILCPVLVVHGEADKMIHWKEAVAIKEGLEKDQVELVLLKNVGHFCWYDNLEHTTLPIDKFLNKHQEPKK